MATTTVSAANTNTRHLNQLIREYVRNARFSRYTGSGPNSIFQMKSESVTGRQIISIPLITRLKNAAVTGSSTLVGNEEAMLDYADVFTPTYRRHAVRIDKEEADKPNYDAVGQARPLLSQWAREDIRDLKIDALGAVYDGTTYASLGTAAEGVKDSWLVNNVDRIIFGDNTGATAGTDHSADLLTVTAGMSLSAGIVDLAKRKAQNADRHIRPVNTREDEEFFVMFVNSWQMRDLRADATMAQANREARMRGTDNPIFRGGDLLYGNVVIREIPEMSSLIQAGEGAAAIDVAPAVLCGAQSVGWAVGAQPSFQSLKEDDYEFITGVGLRKKEHVKKMFFDDIQNGIVTVYTASVADA